jgi:cytochrome c553
MLIRGSIVLSTAVVLFASPALADGDVEKGKALIKAWSCTQCHGLTGNDRSAQEFPVPMLAGQPAAFTVNRLVQYKTIKMENDKSWTRMATFAQGLSRQDMIDIAAYYESQKRY